MSTSALSGFAPSLRGFLSNPYFIARYGLFSGLSTFASEVEGTVLDVGCGSKPYEGLFGEVTSYLGFEIPTEHSEFNSLADCFFDGVSIPVRSGSVDWVISTQTLEHVFEPEHWLVEIRRVLRPGGHLLLTVPLIWGEHEMPADFGRYTTTGLSHLLSTAGFEVQESVRLGKGLVVPLQASAALLAQSTSRWPKFARSIAYLAVLPILNTLGLWAVSLNERRDNGWFLDQVVCAVAVENAVE